MIGALIYHFLGLSGTGAVYAFWSGFGSDIAEFGIFVTIAGAYHKNNCHGKRCWRIGKHIVDGTPWCNKHHEAARKATKA